ncbi:alpha/beta hydrolase, partial [Endozoicomonas sp. ONNA1]|uniref:alpha/beta hydrolase n=1 Tax=Endozoicomonas sp. ONNA1 TaxID=2828740 RepID=UPI0021498CC9
IKRPEYKDFRPLKVMAEVNDDGSHRLFTADIDLFALFKRLDSSSADLGNSIREEAARIERLSANKGAGQFSSELARARWLSAYRRVTEGLGTRERRRFDPNKGTLTHFQESMIDQINEAAAKVGLPKVCHHGTEQDNIKYPERDDKILFIDPEGRVYQTDTFEQVSSILKYYDVVDGFLTYRNRSYKPLGVTPSEIRNRLGKDNRISFRERFSLAPLLQILESGQLNEPARPAIPDRAPVSTIGEEGLSYRLFGPDYLTEKSPGRLKIVLYPEKRLDLPARYISMEFDIGHYDKGVRNHDFPTSRLQYDISKITDVFLTGSLNDKLKVLGKTVKSIRYAGEPQVRVLVHPDKALFESHVLIPENGKPVIEIGTRGIESIPDSTLREAVSGLLGSALLRSVQLAGKDDMGPAGNIWKYSTSQLLSLGQYYGMDESFRLVPLYDLPGASLYSDLVAEEPHNLRIWSEPHSDMFRAVRAIHQSGRLYERIEQIHKSQTRYSPTELSELAGAVADYYDTLKSPDARKQFRLALGVYRGRWLESLDKTSNKFKRLGVDIHQDIALIKNQAVSKLEGVARDLQQDARPSLVIDPALLSDLPVSSKEEYRNIILRQAKRDVDLGRVLHKNSKRAEGALKKIYQTLEKESAIHLQDGVRVFKAGNQLYAVTSTDKNAQQPSDGSDGKPAESLGLTGKGSQPPLALSVRNPETGHSFSIRQLPEGFLKAVRPQAKQDITTSRTLSIGITDVESKEVSAGLGDIFQSLDHDSDQSSDKVDGQPFNQAVPFDRQAADNRQGSLSVIHVDPGYASDRGMTSNWLSQHTGLFSELTASAFQVAGKSSAFPEQRRTEQQALIRKTLGFDPLNRKPLPSDPLPVPKTSAQGVQWFEDIIQGVWLTGEPEAGYQRLLTAAVDTDEPTNIRFGLKAEPGEDGGKIILVVPAGQVADKEFQQAKRLLLRSFTRIKLEQQKSLDRVIADYNQQLQEITGNDQSAYRLGNTIGTDIAIQQYERHPVSYVPTSYVETRYENLADSFSVLGRFNTSSIQQDRVLRAKTIATGLVNELAKDNSGKTPSRSLTAFLMHFLLTEYYFTLEQVSPKTDGFGLMVSPTDALVSVLPGGDIETIKTYLGKRKLTGLTGQLSEALDKLSLGRFGQLPAGHSVKRDFHTAVAELFDHALSLRYRDGKVLPAYQLPVSHTGSPWQPVKPDSTERVLHRMMPQATRQPVIGASASSPNILMQFWGEESPLNQRSGRGIPPADLLAQLSALKEGIKPGADPAQNGLFLSQVDRAYKHLAQSSKHFNGELSTVISGLDQQSLESLGRELVKVARHDPNGMDNRPGMKKLAHRMVKPLAEFVAGQWASKTVTRESLESLARLMEMTGLKSLTIKSGESSTIKRMVLQADQPVGTIGMTPGAPGQPDTLGIGTFDRFAIRSGEGYTIEPSQGSPSSILLTGSADDAMVFPQTRISWDLDLYKEKAVFRGWTSSLQEDVDTLIKLNGPGELGGKRRMAQLLAHEHRIDLTTGRKIEMVLRPDLKLEQSQVIAPASDSPGDSPVIVRLGMADRKQFTEKVFGSTVSRLFGLAAAHSSGLGTLSSQSQGDPVKANNPVGKKTNALSSDYQSVVLANDQIPPVDQLPASSIGRALNDQLYGSTDDRRYMDQSTHALLDDAVKRGRSERITLEGTGGRLKGYFHHGNDGPAADKKVVLFLHGTHSSCEEQVKTAWMHYRNQGMDLLAVNGRGFGDSDGSPGMKGLTDDARTMLSYLINDRNIDPSRIVIHGYSMGASVGAHLAKMAAVRQQLPAAFILDRPMASLGASVVAHGLSVVPGTGRLINSLAKRFNIRENLRKVSRHLPLMLFSDNENLGKQAEKLRKQLQQDGFRVVGEATNVEHEDTNRLMARYKDQIGLFIRSTTENPLPGTPPERKDSFEGAQSLVQEVWGEDPRSFDELGSRIGLFSDLQPTALPDVQDNRLYQTLVNEAPHDLKMLNGDKAGFEASLKWLVREHPSTKASKAVGQVIEYIRQYPQDSAITEWVRFLLAHYDGAAAWDKQKFIAAISEELWQELSKQTLLDQPARQRMTVMAELAAKGNRKGDLAVADGMADLAADNSGNPYTVLDPSETDLEPMVRARSRAIVRSDSGGNFYLVNGKQYQPSGTKIIRADDGKDSVGIVLSKTCKRVVGASCSMRVLLSDQPIERRVIDVLTDMVGEDQPSARFRLYRYAAFKGGIYQVISESGSLIKGRLAVGADSLVVAHRQIEQKKRDGGFEGRPIPIPASSVEIKDILVEKETGLMFQWEKNYAKAIQLADADPILKLETLSGQTVDLVRSARPDRPLPDTPQSPDISSWVLKKLELIEDVHRRIQADNGESLPVVIPGLDQQAIKEAIPANIRETLISSISKRILKNENPLPHVFVNETEANRLATLFVDSVLEGSLPKTGILISRMERLGFSFDADDQSNMAFWYGKRREALLGYKIMVENYTKQKVVTDMDLNGLAQLLSMGDELRKLSRGQYPEKTKDVLYKLFKRNVVITSSYFAAGAQGRVYVFTEGGLRYDNYFWNAELPILRALEKEVRVTDIRVVTGPPVLQPPRDQPLGKGLIDGITMKVRYGSLNAELKSRLPAGDYIKSDFVDVPVKADLVDRVLRKKIPFYLLRSELNIIVVKEDDGFWVSPWDEGGTEKIIKVDDPDDPKKIKAVQDFIL